MSIIDRIHQHIIIRRQQRAQADLARMVAMQCEQMASFRKHRAAALKGKRS